MIKIKYIAIIATLFVTSLKAQEPADSTVTLDKAISIALINNFDLKIASNELKQAQNSNSIGNANLLPSVTLNGGAEYSKTDTENEFAGQSERQIIDDAVSTTYNANLRVDYTLFDGLGNIYTLKKLRSTDELQNTLFKQQMELTMLEVIENYYEVCRAQENLNLAHETMKISRDRYNRVLDQKSYGQASQLDVLNAEVDLNNDSTTILNVEQSFLMSLKNLNVSLGLPVQQEYSVDESFNLDYDKNADYVISSAMMNNSNLISQQQQVNIKNLDVKITKAQKYPTLQAYGQYAYNQQSSDAGFMIYSQNNGMTGGLTLKMNVFNGRQQHTNEQNATLNLLSEQERSNQIRAQIERDASNAYTDYIYKVRIVELQQSSMGQAKLNFEQTKEMFQIGRVNSIEFRAAQQNLLNVAYQYNDARFNAKVAEFYLLRITGDLIKDEN